jgi:hypothetical protein
MNDDSKTGELENGVNDVSFRDDNLSDHSLDPPLDDSSINNPLIDDMSIEDLVTSSLPTPTISSAKHPGGRPTSFRPEYVPLAYKMCLLLNATNKELAGVFDVTEATIAIWKNEYPEFLDAVRKGKELADAKIAKRLFERANGYEHKSEKIFADPKTGTVLRVPIVEKYPPEVTAIRFWLTNRQPAKFRDKQVIEIEDPDKVLAETLGIAKEELPE